MNHLWVVFYKFCWHIMQMDSRSLAVEFAPLIMWRQGDAGTDLRNHLKFTLKPPPKIVDTASNTAAWDLLGM
jgi:hypothetical protein